MLFSRIIVKIISLLFLFSFCTANANTNTLAFGISLGVTTIDDLVSRRLIESKDEHEGINRFTEGKQYFLSPIDFDDSSIQSLLVIFDKNEKASAVIVTYDNDTFDSINYRLQKKYSTRVNERSSVDNSFVVYNNGMNIIEFEKNDSSFQAELRILSDDFFKQYKKDVSSEIL
jgi:hypothetical protein